MHTYTVYCTQQYILTEAQLLYHVVAECAAKRREERRQQSEESCKTRGSDLHHASFIFI
jgi:hypothetical protein